MNSVRALLFAGVCCIAPFGDAARAEMHMDHAGGQALPVESGQSAFAAIHEIVEMLEADPKTDWSKVDIDALRGHLIDMDNVTLRATISYQALPNGERIHVAGGPEVRNSIQRMVMMHAEMAGDTPDWHMTATTAPDGADINVTAKSARGLERMKALGLIGMMAEGMHHAPHHMMLARGTM